MESEPIATIFENGKPIGRILAASVAATHIERMRPTLRIKTAEGEKFEPEELIEFRIEWLEGAPTEHRKPFRMLNQMIEDGPFDIVYEVKR